MSKPLTISLVIPAYNEENYLHACLDAVAAQTEMPDEVLVVNNNSTDRTTDVARTYPFVRIVSEKRQGVLFARRHGFDEAKGEIIASIDADTIIPKDWIATCQTYMLEHPEVSAITGSCYFYDFLLPRQVKVFQTFFYFTLQRLFMGHNVLWASNMALRQSAWQHVRSSCKTAPGIHEDIDLSIQLNKAGQRIQMYENTPSVSFRRGSVSLKKDYAYLTALPKTYAASGLWIHALLARLLKWLVIIVTGLPLLILVRIPVKPSVTRD